MIVAHEYTKALFSWLLLGLAISIGFIFYRTMATRDYPVSNPIETVEETPPSSEEPAQ